MWLRRGLTLVALVVVLGGLALAFPHLSLEAVEAWLEQAGPWAPLAGVGLMALQSLISPIPFALVVIALGVVLGPVKGLLVAWVGELVGATLAYWLARKGWQATSRPEWLTRGRTFWAILAVRLTPGLSFDLVSYTCGAARVPFATFLGATMLGMLPRTAALIFFGHTLWTDPRQAGLMLLALVPLALITVLVLRRR